VGGRGRRRSDARPSVGRHRTGLSRHAERVSALGFVVDEVGLSGSRNPASGEFRDDS
jgi:hypothetical protein